MQATLFDNGETSELFAPGGLRFKLLAGDCLEIMSQLPAESIDLIFADPPYRLSNNGSTCQSGKRASVNKGEWDRSDGFAGDCAFHDRWIGACRRLLKPDGSLWISGTYHNIYICGFILQKQGWHLLNDIIWYKPNAAPNLACRMFTASHETLLWARKSKAARHYFNYKAMKERDWEFSDFLKKRGKQMRSVWALSTPSPTEKKFGKHPTQKPLSLLERVLVAACPPGGVALDPFCGSGTTGVAALGHGAYFIGIDTNRDYLDNLARPRLESVSV